MFKQENCERDRLIRIMRICGETVIQFDKKERTAFVPFTVKYIGQSACYRCSLSFLDLSCSNIISIGKFVFKSCCNLEHVTFPSCLEEICDGAFFGCTGAFKLEFPQDSQLKRIGNNTFNCCTRLKSFHFPSLLKSIGDKAFQYNKISSGYHLENTNVRHVGYHAFNDLRCVKVFLPPTVTFQSIINNCECVLVFEQNHPFVAIDEKSYCFLNGIIFLGKTFKKKILIRRGVERIAKSCFLSSRINSISIPASVIEICEYAFFECKFLRYVHFSRDSRLKEIKSLAFYGCFSIKKISFPRSLLYLRSSAFNNCISLEKVVFPSDSQLLIIESPFPQTIINEIILPQSTREIGNIGHEMKKLKRVFVNNDRYESNKEGTIILSKDKSEMICVSDQPEEVLKIPDGAKVVSKIFLCCSNNVKRIFIPSSVEIIEDGAFREIFKMDIIEFEDGSRLKSLGFKSLPKLRNLIINNENYVKMENGVVISMNPSGIVFVPIELTVLDIDPCIEVIYSNAFYGTRLKNIFIPKSVKKIYSSSFYGAEIDTVTFEEGTELDFIDDGSFGESIMGYIKFPLIRQKLAFCPCKIQTIEFPSNFELEDMNHSCIDFYSIDKIICPRSSISVLGIIFSKNNLYDLEIIEDMIIEEIIFQ